MSEEQQTMEFYGDNIFNGGVFAARDNLINIVEELPESVRSDSRITSLVNLINHHIDAYVKIEVRMRTTRFLRILNYNIESFLIFYMVVLFLTGCAISWNAAIGTFIAVILLLYALFRAVLGWAILRKARLEMKDLENEVTRLVTQLNDARQKQPGVA